MGIQVVEQVHVLLDCMSVMCILYIHIYINCMLIIVNLYTLNTIVLYYSLHIQLMK